MKKKPLTLLIGSVTYTVLPITQEDIDGNFAGRTDNARCQIRVDSRLPATNQSHVAFHEMVHGVSAQYDLHLHEHKVALLSTGLLQVIRDNPDLFRAMTTEKFHL